MEFDVLPQIKNVGLVVDHTPALGQLRSQTGLFVSAQERVVDQAADPNRIGVRRVTGIELERIAFDAYDEITARVIGYRREATAGQ